jgi:putative addiction module component (TIGR02574 family)
MDAASMLQALDRWPAEERIRFLEMAWDRVRDCGTGPELTEAQRADLNRRLAELDANPGNVLTWEDIEASATRPR